MRYFDFDDISHEICNHEMFWFWCNISWNLEQWDILILVWYLMKSALQILQATFRCASISWIGSVVGLTQPGSKFFKTADNEIFRLWVNKITIKTLQPNNFSFLQPYNFTTSQSCNLTTSQSHNLLISQPHNLSTLQPNNLSTLQPYNLTTLQHYNLTASQPFNLSTLQPYNLTTFQPYNLTTL